MTERESVIKELAEVIQYAKNVDIPSIIQRDTLGVDFAFSGAMDALVDYRLCGELLSSADLSVFPITMAVAAREAFRNVSNAIRAIKDFRQTSSLGKQERDQLIGNLNTAVKALYEQAAPVLAIANARPLVSPKDLQEQALADFQRRASDFQERAAATEADIQTKLKTASTSAEEATKAAEAAKKSAAEAGVRNEAIHFAKEAKEHQEAANYWAVAATVTAVGIVIFATYHFFHPYSVTPDNRWEVVQRIVSKVIIFSAIAFFLVFCVKNFHTARHNYVVNKHRQNAMQTFDAFVEGATDPQTKNFVLRQFSRAAFSARPSGYTKNEGDAGGSPVFDILKLFSPR